MERLTLDVGECEFCDELADEIYIRKSFLDFEVKMFCHKQGKLYRQIKKE